MKLFTDTSPNVYHLLRYPMEWTLLLSSFYRVETGLKGKMSFPHGWKVKESKFECHFSWLKLKGTSKPKWRETRAVPWREQSVQYAWRTGSPQRSWGQRGRTCHGNLASVREKRVGMEIKARVSFRKKVKLHPGRSNEVRSGKENITWI